MFEKPSHGGLTMQPSQIARGICFRRYAYGKPIRQIADEAGVPYERVVSVIKGEPMSVEVAARLEGYLKTPCTPGEMYRNRHPDGIMGERRKDIMRRIVRVRMLARRVGIKFGGRGREEKLEGYTDNQLRAYLYNCQDVLKNDIIEDHPKLAELYKLSDTMEAWEYIERFHSLKSSAEVRVALARHFSLCQEKAEKRAARTARLRKIA